MEKINVTVFSLLLLLLLLLLLFFLGISKSGMLKSHFVRSFVRRFATILKMTFVKSLVTVSKFHPQKWRLRLQDKKKVTNIGESGGILFCLISLCNETFNRVFISSQGFRNEIFLRLAQTIQIFLRYYFNFDYFFAFSTLPHSTIDNSNSRYFRNYLLEYYSKS